MSKPQSESVSRKRELFLKALEQEDPQERAAFLDGACGDDADLRAGVAALLRSHRDDSFLEQAAVAVEPGRTAVIAITEQPGDMIGRYKLLERLGEGGFGVVYMAEQTEPVKRRVALKIIKVGMDTQEVVARFEAERQALAMMEHPNIAKVLEAGSTDAGARLSPAAARPSANTRESSPGYLPTDEAAAAGDSRAPFIPAGRPYFVMELVRGIRITDYCDQNELGLADRLKLFMQVCHAVQHAHQKGIIHRDLKPSNILVTLHDGVPVPKVIDFGIAKATQQELTEKTMFTRLHQFIGTPAYMSPEQAELSGLDIDTRSDIYSLGVLLYELLVGQPPFDGQELLKAGLDEMRRKIREDEPARPSTRLSSLIGEERTKTASRRSSDAAKLVTILRGDVDWIVMKCLEKDRTRRYETANGLAADIQRHLSNEPVVARPPSRLYQFQKMAVRNRIAFAAAAAVLVTLVVGLTFSTWTLVRERAARRQTAVEAAKSQRVAKFLKDMIRGLKPSVALGRDTALLREIAEQTLEQMEREKDIPPEVQVELRATVGGVFHALLDSSRAQEMHRETLPRMRELLGNEHPQLAELLLDFSCVLADQSKHKESEELAREALALTRKLHGPEHPDVARALELLANSLAHRQQFTEGEELIRQALDMNRKLRGPEHHDVALGLNRLAGILDDQRRYEEAEPLFLQSLAMMKRLHGDVHPDIARVLRTFADSCIRQKKWSQAEGLYREHLTILRKLLGSEHDQVGVALHQLAFILNNAGRYGESEPFAREELALFRKLRGEEHVQVARALHELGIALHGQGRHVDAEVFLRQNLAVLRKLPPSEHGGLKNSLRNLGLVLVAQQKLAEAEPFFQECATLARPQAATEPDFFINSLSELGDVLYRQKKLAEADPILREALELLRAQPAPDKDIRQSIVAALGRLLTDRAWAERRGGANFSPPQPGELHSAKEAESRSPVEMAREGERLLRESVAARLQLTNATAWRTGDFRSRLGSALVSLAVTDSEINSAGHQATLAEAEALLLEGNEAVQQAGPAERKFKRDALERLVRLYEAWEKPAQAAEWRAKLEGLDQTAGETKADSTQEARP